jgi:hypothetical protein
VVVTARQLRTAASPALTALAAAAALLLPACGGTDDGRPARPTVEAAAVVDACAAADERLAQGWEFRPIVDFEPLDGMPKRKLEAECAPSMPCSFYFNYDSALSPALSPADPPSALCDLGAGVVTGLNQGMGPPFAYPLPEARCGRSQYAYHQQGQHIAVCVNPKTGRQGWGATLAITLDANPTNSGQALKPFDASSWDGVSLWVRLGDASSNHAMLVSAKDIYTGQVPFSLFKEMQAYCSTADGMPDAKKCDPFGLAVLLEPEWRFVTVPFARLQQKGFGVPSPLGEFDVSQLLGFELGFSAGDWDVWVDDIALYREPR